MGSIHRDTDGKNAARGNGGNGQRIFACARVGASASKIFFADDFCFIFVPACPAPALLREAEKIDTNGEK